MLIIHVTLKYLSSVYILEAPAALPSEQLLSPLMNKMETR